MTLGQLIKHHRELKGLTQLELAKLINHRTPQFISNVERDLVSLPMAHIPVISKALEIDEALLVKTITKYQIEKFKTRLNKIKI